MTSKSPVRSADDVDEVTLSYAEIKALCAGNPLIKEKMQLDSEVAKLKLLKSEHQSLKYRLEDALLKGFPKSVETYKGNIAGFESDIVKLSVNTPKSADVFPAMTLGKTVYTDKAEAGAALLNASKDYKGKDVKIGSYRGFDMYLSFESITAQLRLTLKGTMSYTTELGKDAFGNITRINNTLASIPTRLEAAQTHLSNTYQQIENAKLEIEKPFPLEEELKKKTARLTELDILLNLDDNTPDNEIPEAGITPQNTPEPKSPGLGISI